MAKDGQVKFQVEKAKSGRSTCKGCSKLIAKDELRVGCSLELSPEAAEGSAKFGQGVKWHHVKASCLGQFRKTSKWWRENMPDEFEGLDELGSKESELIEEVVATLQGDHPSERSKKGKANKAKTATKKTAKDESDEGGESDDGDASQASKSQDGDSDEESAGSTEASKPALKEKPAAAKRKLPAHMVENSEDEDESPKKKAKGASKSSKKSKDESDSDGSDGGEGGDDEDLDSDDDGKSRKKKAAPKKKAAAKPKAKAAPKKGAASNLVFNAACISDEQNAEGSSIMNALASKPVTQLKEMLKKNNQKQSGKKEELLERIAEMKVLGNMPMCPDCGQGRPRWDKETGNITCPGFFANGGKQDCDFNSDSIERTEWID